MRCVRADQSASVRFFPYLCYILEHCKKCFHYKIYLFPSALLFVVKYISMFIKQVKNKQITGGNSILMRQEELEMGESAGKAQH